MSRLVSLLLYYGLARKLPGSEFPLGKAWRGFRGACVGGFLKSVGHGLEIEERVYFADGRQVTLGNRCVINAGTSIFGADIGDEVMLGPGVLILCRNHSFDALDRPMRDQDDGPVDVPVIGAGAWLGARVIVLPGRRIGEGAIVGAGAVVSRDVEPYSIVAGNPATVIGSRLPERLASR
jgi:acetyltransferase-like isoleucine patch superfamily enzyme